MKHEPRLILDCRNTLGEGIIWCDRLQALYWTDIQASRLWCYHPQTQTSQQWPLPERLACLALCAQDDWLLLGLASRLAFFHLPSGRLQTICTVEAGKPTRLNDGACDRQGRFVFGTLHEPPTAQPQQAIGAFYRLDAEQNLQCLPLPAVAISNSLAFDPQGERLYYCDSPSREIRCCDYADHLGPSRRFARLDGEHGEPDGSAIDRLGGLWNAQWGRSRVVRYAPDGSVTDSIELPVSQPTRIAFGGPELTTLYISSAREGLDPQALAREPQAGGLFAIEVALAGLPEPRYRGAPKPMNDSP